MNVFMYERIEPKKIEALINHPEVDTPIRNSLKKYIKQWDNKHKGFKVEYETKGLMIGRKYAKGSLSLQSFKKSIRETLVHDTHTDIDINNCHFVLLAQYCDKNGLKCNCLDDFVCNRTLRLQSIIDLFKTTRKVAKELFITMLYGGDMNNYCCDNGFDININLPEWLMLLEKELKAITSRICSIESSTMDSVKRLKKKEYNNKEASCLSYVLQVIEDEVICKAVVKLKQLGFNVDTLCFDGCLVEATNIKKNVLDELSCYCFETTGYKVDFSFKPMVSHFEIIEKEYDFSDYDFKCVDEYDQIYCHSLNGKVSMETYQLKKAYIEHFLCKVQQPEPLYVFQNGNHKKPTILNPTQASLLFKPIDSGFTTKVGNISFFEKWSNDINHRLYRVMDFIPYNNNNPLMDDKVFNLFEGFNPDIYGDPIDKQTIQKRIKPYLELCQELCGGDDEHAMYLHKFFGQIFQDPNNKPPVCIILKGKQGVGKNMILNAIGNMLNPVHYTTSSKVNDFFGEHAEGYCRKLLVNPDEAEGKDTFDFEGRLKSMITENTLMVNSKNMRPYEIRNVARTIITTNKPNPIPIDVKSKDRRYVVFKATDKYLTKSSKFWTGLYNHMRNPDVMSALYQWYMSFDLEDFDWSKRRPITQAYKEMCNLYSPIEALFFEELYDTKGWLDYETEKDKTEKDTVFITTMNLFTKYECFCKRNRFLKDETKATSSRSFINKLIELEFPLERRKRSNNNYFEFNPQQVYDYIYKKRWIQGYRVDEEEQEIANEGENAPDDYFDL
jgi:hypothetical protein